ncbi:MAG TPA: hypothetical protein DEG90_09040, partial [Porphyromonadaceae bacterium]|nr:hypothetical protein [Porphyromonadaceae bacterium]
RERLDEVAAAGVILKRSRLDETGLDGGDDDAAGVVGIVAVFITVGAVEGAGYSEGDLSGVCDYEIHNIIYFIDYYLLELLKEV